MIEGQEHITTNLKLQDDTVMKSRSQFNKTQFSKRSDLLKIIGIQRAVRQFMKMKKMVKLEKDHLYVRYIV